MSGTHLLTSVGKMCLTGASRTILMDCTTASPLAKEIKEYKPGRVADALQSEKSTYNIRIDATLHFRC
jgi:hypothetical protein